MIQYLSGVLFRQAAYDKSYDIGGPEILTYRQMLMQFAEVRKLKRIIWVVPVMTPRLSSYWLFFITSTSYRLAVNLVNSMKVEVICRETDLQDLLGLQLLTYKEAVRQAIEQDSDVNKE